MDAFQERLAQIALSLGGDTAMEGSQQTRTEAVRNFV